MIYFVIVFISFLLEGLITNLFALDTLLFQNCFTLVSLLVLCPYFYYKPSWFYGLAFLAGMLLDITYLNTLFLQGLLFLGMAFLIKKLNVWISSRPLNLIFLTVIVIIVYRIVTYFLMIVIGLTNFSFPVLAQSITSSLILNIIYVLVIYYIMEFLRTKFHLIKVD